MKKLSMVITVGLLAVCLSGIPVFAKAQPALFSTTAPGVEEPIDGSGGKVIINLPKGNVGMVVQGMVRNLFPKTTYYVYLYADGATFYTGPGIWVGGEGVGWVQVTTLRTSQAGNGSFHINIAAGDLVGGGPYNISVYIDSIPEPPYTTVLVSDPKISVTIP